MSTWNKLVVGTKQIPNDYRRALQMCCSRGGEAALPDTALVYNLMMSTKLPMETLGLVWSLVNRTAPGQLTADEFYFALALIALIQVLMASFGNVALFYKCWYPI